MGVSVSKDAPPTGRLSKANSLPVKVTTRSNSIAVKDRSRTNSIAVPNNSKGQHNSSQRRLSHIDMTMSMTSRSGATSATPHIPSPCPPSAAKDEVFDLRAYTVVDEHAIATPERLLRGSFRQLLTYLTDGMEDDMSKVRVLFRWLTSVDVYNIRFDDDVTPQSPNDYLRKIKNGTGNHAHLFAGICQMCGVVCAIINGMNKSASYEVGKKVDRGTMGAQWNAVFVQGQWRLIDPFWASSCIVGRSSGEWKLVENDGDDKDQEWEKEDEVDQFTVQGEAKHLVNEFYFLTDPDRFIWTHFPDDEKWQMLETPITVRQFEEHFYIRERFHLLGLTDTENSHRKSVLTTNGGQITIEFAIPPQYSQNYKFKYLLYLSRRALADNKKFFLERFVVYEQRNDLVCISLRFPVKGTFKFDLYGLDSADTNIFDLVCTYIIHCPCAMVNCLPLPDIPPLGWGPTSKTREMGMTPTSHKTAVITTDNSKVTIIFNVNNKCHVEQRLRHAVIDEAYLTNYCLNRQENGEVIISVRLPQKGEYALKVSSTPWKAGGEIPTVYNFLIKCVKDDPNQQPFPHVPSGHLGPTYYSTIFRVKPISHTEYVVTLPEGKATMSFEKEKHLSLKCEINHTNHNNYNLERLADSGENIAYYELDLPVAGEYAFNVFAKDKTRKNDKKITHVFSYLILSKGYKVDIDEVDDEIEEYASVPTETVETSDNQVWIPKPEGNNILANLRQKGMNTSVKKTAITVCHEDNTSYYVVSLNEYGDYAFNLYSSPATAVVKNIARYQINRKSQSEVYQHNVNTIMDAVKENLVSDEPEPEREPNDLPFPVVFSPITPGAERFVPPDSPKPSPDTKRRSSIKNAQTPSPSKRSVKDMTEKEHKDDTKTAQCLNQLRRAIEMRDKAAIETNFKICQDNDIQDELLEKAKRVVIAIVVRDKLTAAIVKRERPPLEDAIVEARNENYDNVIDLQISVAQKLRTQLQRLEQLRQEVLSMDAKTVAELRSYTNPPTGIYPVMKATYYLLTNGKVLLQDWSSVTAQMGKTGKWSIKRNVALFDPHLIYTDVAEFSKVMIEDISLVKMRDISAGAATFFIWVSGMIDVVEETGGAGESPSGWAMGSLPRTKASSRAKSTPLKP